VENLEKIEKLMDTSKKLWHPPYRVPHHMFVCHSSGAFIACVVPTAAEHWHHHSRAAKIDGALAVSHRHFLTLDFRAC
jgi:hypothetical protein